MSSDVAIKVRDVTKHYLMFERPEDRLKQMVVPRLQRIAGRQPRRYYRDFAALNGISFEVKRGETVGIIGRNGCGKSTLLQIVCGTLQPSSGSVEVNGRIAALLELGAGFNPEFTGRENVFMNAAILGLSHAETEARFDAIARFADIGMFIDQPVKTYSSGMYVRLAFATAINVDPDILVVDEALSVGDEAFQRKCFVRIEDIKDKGGTILFVSHGAPTIVQLCDRAMLIDRGEKILEGRPKTVVSQYQRFINLSGPNAEQVREEIKAMDGWGGASKSANTQESAEAHGDNEPSAGTVGQQLNPAIRVTEKKFETSDDQSWFDPALVSQASVEYESHGARIRDAKITTLDGRQVNILAWNLCYQYKYQVEFLADARGVSFGMLMKTATGLELCGGSNNFQGRRVDLIRAGEVIDVSFGFRCRLGGRTYFCNAGVIGTALGETKYLHRLLDIIAFRVIDENHWIDSDYIFPMDCSLSIHKIEAGSDAKYVLDFPARSDMIKG